MKGKNNSEIIITRMSPKPTNKPRQMQKKAFILAFENWPRNRPSMSRFLAH